MTPTATGESVDLQQVRMALGILHLPGAPVELRAFGEATWVGAFADHDALVRAAAGLGEDVRSTCVTIHALGPSVVATNRLRRGGRGVRAADVARYQFLPIDLDPLRPPDCSSTAEEHTAALKTAEALWAHLHLDHRWPHPVLMASSGNGAHLLYLIDFPTEEQLLVRRTLEALARLPLIPAAVKVDTAVHNPARVWKLYGTWARKGPNTPERPWRRSEMWSWETEPVGFVGREQLEAIAGTEEPTPEPTRPMLLGDLRPGSRYVERAVVAEIKRVLLAAPGDRNDTLNRAAFSLGQLVGAGLVEESSVAAGLASAGQAVGLDEREIGPTIRSGLASGKATPRTVTQ